MIQLLSTTDRDFPPALAAVRGAPFLYVKGCAARLASRPAVAIVGARAASRAGLRFAGDLAASLAAGGATILSGGALGIDAAAHDGALGSTVAVLPGDLDAPYPARNRPLFEAILAAGGALASPFAPGQSLRRGGFPRRNQVLGAWADLVVVVEAGPLSGSLGTAAAAHRHGRMVAARPGSAGAELLLAQGALRVDGAGDVVDALAGRARRPAPAVSVVGEEARVLAALDAVPRDAVQVATRSGLGPIHTARMLGALVGRGLALQIPGCRFVRAAPCDGEETVTLHG